MWAGPGSALRVPGAGDGTRDREQPCVALSRVEPSPEVHPAVLLGSCFLSHASLTAWGLHRVEARVSLALCEFFRIYLSKVFCY